MAAGTLPEAPEPVEKVLETLVPVGTRSPVRPSPKASVLVDWSSTNTGLLAFVADRSDEVACTLGSADWAHAAPGTRAADSSSARTIETRGARACNRFNFNVMATKLIEGARLSL